MIYKYTLQLIDELQRTTMPVGAQIIHVGYQRQPKRKDDPEILGFNICMWAIANLSGSQEWRDFRVVGTGHPLPEKLSEYKYIGTAQESGIEFVWHVIEIVEEEVL